MAPLLVLINVIDEADFVRTIIMYKRIISRRVEINIDGESHPRIPSPVTIPSRLQGIKQLLPTPLSTLLEVSMMLHNLFLMDIKIFPLNVVISKWLSL